MQFSDKENKDVWRFDSWSELVNYADTRECKGERSPSSRRAGEPNWDGDGDMPWNGTESFEEAKKIALAGWPEGTAKVKALAEVLMDKVTSLVDRVTLEYDVTGQDFDIPMMLQGEPEHWYTQVSHLEQGQGTRALRLVFNCGASAGIKTQVIMAKGAAVAALIECLEFSGFRVELGLAQCVRGHNGYKADTYCPLKAADQPLDIDRLSFALAHPATLRRLMFGVEEGSERFMEICGYGYGTPSEAPTDERGDIYIGESFLGEPQWTDETSAVNWILKTLAEQGVKVEGLQEVPA